MGKLQVPSILLLQFLPRIAVIVGLKILIARLERIGKHHAEILQRCDPLEEGAFGV